MSNISYNFENFKKFLSNDNKVKENWEKFVKKVKEDDFPIGLEKIKSIIENDLDIEVKEEIIK